MTQNDDATRRLNALRTTITAQLEASEQAQQKADSQLALIELADFIIGLADTHPDMVGVAINKSGILAHLDAPMQTTLTLRTINPDGQHGFAFDRMIEQTTRLIKNPESLEPMRDPDMRTALNTDMQVLSLTRIRYWVADQLNEQAYRITGTTHPHVTVLSHPGQILQGECGDDLVDDPDTLVLTVQTPGTPDTLRLRINVNDNTIFDENPETGQQFDLRNGKPLPKEDNTVTKAAATEPDFIIIRGGVVQNPTPIPVFDMDHLEQADASAIRQARDTAWELLTSLSVDNRPARQQILGLIEELEHLLAEKEK